MRSTKAREVVVRRPRAISIIVVQRTFDDATSLRKLKVAGDVLVVLSRHVEEMSTMKHRRTEEKLDDCGEGDL